MRKLVLCAEYFLAGVLLASCATAPKVSEPVIGQERVVERSAKERPEWIEMPSFEEGGMLYFSGGVRDRASYSLGLRQAKAEAIKNLAEGIQARVRTEFTEAIQGSNINESDLGEFVQDAVGIITDNLNIQGLVPKENYWEKVEKVTATGVEYKYNCFCLLAISKKDYLQARDIALNGLAEKAKKEQNKKAEAIATQLLERLTK